MQAIILAAGKGSRLRPITNNKPKTLIEVNNQPILGYILNSLRKNGVIDIIICTGFKKEKILSFCKTNFLDLNLKFVVNEDYATTNNMYSLYLACKEMNPEDTLLMNADLVFEPEIIRELLNEPRTAVAVDTASFDEESMKVIMKDKYINSISKKITKEESYGCSIDVYKINREDFFKIFVELKRIIEEQKEFNLWTEVMLDNLFKSGQINAVPCDIKGLKWYEIDDFQDLNNAEMLFNNKI